MPHATHVLIRGHVFTYAEKAPFVASGVSVLGALEYDEATDKTKCHECGVWINGLGNHIKAHRLRRKEYNARHGLRSKSALCGLGTRRKHSVNAKLQIERGTGVASPKCAAAREKGFAQRKGRVLRSNSPEMQNETSRCQAQLQFRIQVLAAEIGHTPTANDLRHAGIELRDIRARFSSVPAGMKLAGLEPTHPGQRPSSLPRNFPAKPEIEKRWNDERMPWPADYFKVDPYRKRA